MVFYNAFKYGFESEAVCTVLVDRKLALPLRLSLVRDGAWSVFSSNLTRLKNLKENLFLFSVLRPHRRPQHLVRFVGGVLDCAGFLFGGSLQSVG